MNKRWKQIVGFILPMLVLSGCIQDLEKAPSKEKKVGPDEVVVQTTNNQLSDNYYRSVIRDGKYQLAASASVDNNLTSSGNSQAYEEGLLRISKKIFPTDQYFLQEGQIIDEDTMTSWLGRETKDNPDGLNPVLEEDQTSETTTENAQAANDQAENQSTTNEQVVVDAAATPIYLAQIMEKDIMVEDGDNFKMGGIVVGLAMNSEYSYTDANGVVHKQEISMGELRERGKAYANIIVGRLRNTKELRSVPIVVGIFKQAPSTSVVGGSYVLSGVSREGNYVSDWTEHNDVRVALPVAKDAEGNDQYKYFDDFSNQIINFFPNLNGVSGEGLYVDGALASLKINIVSQFYQQTEITALTQQVTDSAQKNLPEGVNIEITINSAAGVESYIGRQAGAKEFQTHIFQ